MKRIRRNLIDRARVSDSVPFDPRQSPDIIAPVKSTPGAPPDISRFAMSVFDARPELVEDFWIKAPEVELVNLDGLNSLIYSIQCPVGFQMILRGITLCGGILYDDDSTGTARPLTAAMGPNSPPVAVVAPQIRYLMNDSPIGGVKMTDDTALRINEYLFGGFSTNVYVRMQPLDTFAVNVKEVNNLANVTWLPRASFAYFTGQLLASDGCQTQEMGLTKRPIPVHETMVTQSL